MKIKTQLSDSESEVAEVQLLFTFTSSLLDSSQMKCVTLVNTYAT